VFLGGDGAGDEVEAGFLRGEHSLHLSTSRAASLACMDLALGLQSVLRYGFNVSG
jgi:hypothetical protein